jgi:hypothetical protein
MSAATPADIGFGSPGKFSVRQHVIAGIKDTVLI